MNAVELTSQARQAGADLVGIAPASRWAQWPAAANPRSIQPKCQSVIVLGRRILRGAFRGVEEGTSFGNTYNAYGVHWHEQEFLSRVIHKVAWVIEAAGFEAVPLFGGRGTDATPVRLDAKALAHEAGLGSVGKGGFFLTQAYGHRQRFGLVLTELALEGNPVVDLDLCAGCNACLKACPLQAMTEAGQAPFVLDSQKCAVCANGRMESSPNSYERLDRLASSCGRACLVALEKRITNRFDAPFRRRSVWTRDIHGKATVHPLSTEGAQS